MPLLDTSALTRIGGPLGSNPAGVYEDRHGQRYYIKTLESVAHLRNEYIASKLYELAGVPMLSYQLTTDPYQLATRWLDLDKKSIKHFSHSERQQAKQWFAVHAWTANWDVAGYHGDNLAVIKNKVITLDVGGALNFRAMGDPKGKAFSSEVNEINSLRKDLDNPHAVKLFSDMTIDEITRSINKVTCLCEQAISDTILQQNGHQKLVNKMLTRKHFLANIDLSSLEL